MIHFKQYIACLMLLGGAMNVSIASPNCAVTIHSDDQIHWDTPTIKVSKSCESFSITLVHDGQLDKGIMGHNWVLTKEQDKEDVAKAVIFDKDKGYVNDDPRIIAHTSLVGGGERTTVTLDVKQLEKEQKYSYFCSYPEHIGLMQGTLELVD